jgi:hypothetical protein
LLLNEYQEILRLVECPNPGAWVIVNIF